MLFNAIAKLIQGPLDKLIPDNNKKAEFKHDLEMEILRSGMGQMEINKTEALHPSIFVAGWRPFIGWVCGVALFWHFMGHDLLSWARIAFFPDVPEPPLLGGSETLVTVLLSMLGLGGLRTIEKIKGVDRNSLTSDKKPT